MTAISTPEPRDLDVSVVSTGHHVADARLHRHCAALHRAGLTVEVLARGKPDEAPAGTTFRSLPNCGRVRRGLYAALLPARTHGRIVLTLDPELVPFARLRRGVGRGRRRLVVDVHEDYLALLDDRGWARGGAGLVARALARGATSLSQGADLTVVADEHVPPKAAGRRLVIPNMPDFSQLPAPRPAGGTPRALYIGDVRASRGLFTMLETLTLASGWTLDVVGPVHEADRERLARFQAGSPAASRIRFHGRMPPAQAWRLARGAWVGLSLLDPTPAFQEAMPSKIYEYLACGLPVLTSTLPRPAALVRAAGAGVPVTGAQQAAAVLSAWSGPGNADFQRHRAAALAWATRGRRRTNPYDLLAQEVVELLGTGGRRNSAAGPVVVDARRPGRPASAVRLGCETGAVRRTG